MRESLIRTGKKRRLAAAVIALAAGLLSAASADEPVRLDTILYGASYYLEYMPVERLDKDVALMAKAGINFVRVGESTWGVLEPEDGRFDFAWLERVLDRLHEAGIRVILGTPTYSIPAWLFKAHPEIQVRQINQPRYAYGLRQMSDVTHPVYRRYAERVIRRLVGLSGTTPRSSGTSSTTKRIRRGRPTSMSKRRSGSTSPGSSKRPRP